MSSAGYADWIAAMHPHNNCAVCHGTGLSLTENEQLEALIPAMRIDAQGTLAALQRRGYEIRKRGE